MTERARPPRQRPPRILAVVVHHADAGTTARCLAQLADAGLRGPDVVLVGSGAPAADLRTLAAPAPGPDLLAPAQNRGFAAAANLGLRRAFARGAEAALLINPDVSFGPELVDELAARRGMRREIRMPEISRADAPRRTWFAGAWKGRVPGRWRARRVGDPREEVDLLWACCWLIGAEAWRRAGPFDEGYFLYFEDVALCRRAREAGVTLRVCPRARLRHTVGGSLGGERALRRRYWMARSGLRWARGAGRGATAHRVAADAGRAAALLARGRLPALGAHARGLRDGWREPTDAERRRAATLAAPATCDARDGPRFSVLLASAQLPTAEAALRALLAQGEADRIEEVLVCGPPRGLAALDPRVRELPTRPGPACLAYNRGLEAARGSHLLFLDGDCLLPPRWLAGVARRHAEGWQAVSGAVRVPDGPRHALAYNLGLFHGFLEGRGASARRWLPTMCLSVELAAARAIGPFREDLARSYDMDWTLRLHESGARLLFDGGLAAEHHPCGITEEILLRTWHAGGACSQAVRRAHARHVAAPAWLGSPAFLERAAPALAAGATLRCAWRCRRDARVLRVLPLLWRSKRAWCRGAAEGARRGPIGPARYAYRPVEGPGRDA